MTTVQRPGRRGRPEAIAASLALPATRSARANNTPTSGVRPAGQVRIIGGLWKRSVLPVPQHAGLRPTPDRVRETLFNWLGQDLTGWHVLDAFAGSGALGFEAASRGAARALLIEREPHVARMLEATKQRLAATAVQVLCGDAMQWMQRATATAAQEDQTFELILLDPPYDAADLAALAVQAAMPLLAPAGWLYVESPQPLLALPEGLQAMRTLKAGAVFAQLLRRGA